MLLKGELQDLAGLCGHMKYSRKADFSDLKALGMERAGEHGGVLRASWSEANEEQGVFHVKHLLQCHATSEQMFHVKHFLRPSF